MAELSIKRWYSRPFLLIGYGVACLIVASFLAYGFWGGAWSNERSSVKNDLVVEEQFLDLKNVWVDSKFPCRLPIRNGSKHTIDVLGFSTSCSCLTITPQAFKLKPGEEIVVNLVLDLGRGFNKKDSDEVPFEISLSPQVKDKQTNNEGWSIRGTARRLLKVVPMSIGFSEEHTRGETLVPVRAKVFAAAPLKNLLVKSSRQEFLVTIEKKTAYEFELTVSPPSTLSVGRFDCKVFLQPVEGEQKEPSLPESVVSVTGRVHAEVEAIPSTLIFGAQPCGEKVSKTVCLISRTGKSFKLKSWRIPVGLKDLSKIKVEKGIDDSIVLSLEVDGPPDVHHKREVILELLYGTDNLPLEIRVPLSYYTLSKGS
jgi:hypothetical protein